MMMAGRCVYRSRRLRPDRNRGNRERDSTTGDEVDDRGEGEDDADEVCSTRRCCRSGSRRTDFSCRGLSSEEDGAVGPWQSTEELDQLADEAVRLLTPLITNTAAEALPPLPGTHRKAERRPARGYIQEEGTELWGGC